MSSKLRDLTALLIIQLVLTLPFYTANAYGLAISDVKVANTASNSATIEWSTDNISNGKVRYGKTTALGFTQRHDNFIGNHTLSVFNGIDSDTLYFFSVESADLAGSTAVDNNSNSFYTFRTTDITPPPQVTGLAALSATSSSIFLSWNSLTIGDLSHYVIYRDRIPIANSTSSRFNDTNLNAVAQHSYKVSAVDSSGNEGPLSDTIIASTAAIDSTAPAISNVDVLAITDAAARVTWLTDENSTSMVFYGINKTDKTKSSGDLVANHSIVIDGLTKNTIFIFSVRSCDSSNNCANSSIQSFTAGRDTTLPFINLSIPRFVNRRVIDIAGSTEPFSSVTLFVNNMNIPKRSLSNNEVGSSGRFIFSQVQLDQDNIIKIAIADKSGNKNQKIFEASVDAEDPVVKLDEMPSLTSKPNVTITGTANEPVVIQVFVDADVNESSALLQITGLSATKVGQNSVELHWDESKDRDFSHYVVYRSDSSPIAITKPANFNLFIDALVDSGKSYTYQVSAVSVFAKESPKSEPITATTLRGGAILNLRHADVDIFEDFRKPLLVVNATGAFNFGVRLSKGDGNYKIKLIFEDRAGNTVLFDRSVTLDTKKPEVKIISPPSGALVFENVANEIDVAGKTKPNARVHLFIDRTPFSFFNNSLELSGLPNEIQSLPETNLDAKCRLSVSASFCKTGADFSVSADSQGNFKFDRVDLTAIFGGAARLKEVPVTEFRDTVLNPESQQSKKTTIVVIATDQTGQRGVATQTVNIGTCWSGNQSWDIIPLTQYQSPAFLSTERMAEGTETVYFYFNYSYIGRGTSPAITGITMSKACGTRELLDPRFNISCQIMPAGVPTQLLRVSSNPAENRVSYSAALLGRFPGMDSFLENDWKSFLNAINKELTFPVLVRITYKHDTGNDGILKTETQTTCEQVSYVVDNSILDPRKILPDWLLFDFVDFLQASIKTLTDAQEQINKLVDYVAIGCFASGAAYFAIQIYRRWTTFWEEKAYSILNQKTISQLSEWIGLKKIALNPEKKDYENDCKTTIEEIVKKNNGFKLKYVNDIDLGKCFPASASAWDLEAETWQLMRYSCDRIFGHSAPSKWTESKKDDVLIKKAQSIEGCEGDESALGQPLKAENCAEFARRYPRYSNAASLGADKQCVLARTPKTQTGRIGEAVFTVGDIVSGSERLYKLDHIERLGDFAGQSFYAVKSKASEFSYLTAQSKSCEERCEAGKQGKRAKVDFKSRTVEIVEDKSGKGVAGECMAVQDCTSLNAKDSNNPFTINKKPVKYARNWGFTSDCFYDPNNQELSNPSVVSDNPAQRLECCCISTQDEKGQPTNYYQPDDVDPSNPNKKVHESKTKPREPPQGEKPASDSTEDPRYADMKWSYRYSKERFQAISNEKIRNQYHPNRYIEERDFPACFGQDDIIYGSLGEPERTLMIDPSRDYFAATFQCAHLVGISQRLQFLKNLMTSMSTCLIQVRTTGRGDAGACKELFTQYLCNSIWQLINFFTSKGCAKTEYGSDPNTQSDDILEHVRAGFKSVSDSAGDLQSSISQEYGNAKLNELLGTGEESIARKVCLAAFGYDWELSIRNLVDAAYTTPFATLVQPITRSREFLTISPVNLKPKYEYRASWIINPGCDFERYDVYLSCAGRKQLDQYPNQVNCGAVGAPSVAYAFTAGKSQGITQCDCIGLPDEKARLVFSGKLKQNVLEDKALPSGQRVIEDNFRYDHLKFVLRADRKIPANIKPNCFPTGFDDGVFYAPLIEKTARDVLDCRIDPLSGSATPCCSVDQNTGAFTCGSGAAFTSRKGTAEFMDIKINDKNALGGDELVFPAGEALKVDTTIRSVGQNKCIKLAFDGQTQVQEVFEGIQQYTLQTQPVALGARTDIAEPAGIKVQKIDLQNQKDIFINIGFWDIDNNLFFFDEDDEMFIGNKNDRKKIMDIKNQQNSRFNDGTEASFANNQIMLKKENAEVAVISVEAQRDANGVTIKDLLKDSSASSTKAVPFVQGTIRALKPAGESASDSAQPQQQQKTLAVGLYHTKDDPTLFGISSCDFNDPVMTAASAKQERSIKVKIEQKPVSSALQAPIISGPAARAMLPFKKDNILITATITHADGIAQAELECKIGNTQPFKVKGTSSGSSNYEFYVDQSNIDFAGEYSCTLNAKSSNNQARAGSMQVRFEVECGGDNNVYSRCSKDNKDGKCKSGNAEISGLQCIANSASS